MEERSHTKVEGEKTVGEEAEIVNGKNFQKHGCEGGQRDQQQLKNVGSR